jgi:hypothetical protein
MRQESPIASITEICVFEPLLGGEVFPAQNDKKGNTFTASNVHLAQ